MKIRNGFVSNSSSSSFSIPLSFLTDEQKEILFYLDEYKEIVKQNIPNFPKNEEYHKIYNDMIEADEWWDSSWSIGMDKEKVFLSGGTMMYNGSILIFMDKIGIDTDAMELITPGHVTMPENPEALKIFAKKREDTIKWYSELEEGCVEKEYLFNGPIEDNPYTVDDSEFEHWSGDIYRYESTDGNDYFKIIEK